MRKKEKQEGKVTQLSLFGSEQLSFRQASISSDRITTLRGKSKFFSLLARNRALTGDLLERVMSPTNLSKAYEAVRRNKGMGGVDGMEVEDLSIWLQSNGKELRRKVLEETYEPQAILGLEIPKQDGGIRRLGIPTVLDRLIQQAIHRQLSILYEPLFSATSYGFRPQMGAHQAVNKSSEYISQGKEWVVDIDLKNFFDKVNHDRLMQRLHKGIGDDRLLRLIRKFLRAGMLENGLEQQRIAGTPQGSPFSPLLSNIVLDELDKELEKRGHDFVRYADDCNIYVKSERAGKRVLESMTKFIEEKLKLQVNWDKSGVRRCSKVKFLGYTIMPQGKIRVADKSIKRFRDKVRTITKRNRGRKFIQIIEELNKATRGWVNYFRLANSWLPWQNLDGWMRHRLRCYRLKQCGRQYTIYKFLRKLNADRQKAWNAIRYGGAWWKLSKRVVCQKAMGNHWFTIQGLLTLEGLHKQLKC